MSTHDDEIQNDVLGEQIDLGCIERLGAALTHVPDVPHVAPDAVNHPAHYGGDTTYEVIKVAEAWALDEDAYLFNVLKYIARAGKKNPETLVEDLRKARTYLDRRINHPKESK